MRNVAAMRRVLAFIAIAATGLLPLPATAQTTHTCFGEPATVVGTPESDHLHGDVVVGLGGNDQLSGRLVCAGKGNDGSLTSYEAVNAGPGHDLTINTRGPLAIGGPGNDDFADANIPKQVRRGGEGDDSMTLEGYEGELDIFYGGIGNDGSDAEEGFFSNNTRQYGGDGNDSFIGGGGKDYLFGEAGDDFLTTAMFLDDNIADFIDGGDGFDTCRVRTGDRAINCEDVTVVS